MLEHVRHTSTPYFLIINFRQLFGEVVTISSTSVELEGLASFGAILYTFIQLLEDGEICFFEDGSPVKSTTTGGGGACAVHVVHAITDLSKKTMIEIEQNGRTLFGLSKDREIE